MKTLSMGLVLVMLVVSAFAACAPRLGRVAAVASGPMLVIRNAGDQAKVFDGTTLLASLSPGEGRTVRLHVEDAPRVFTVRTDRGEAYTRPERIGVGTWRLEISPTGIVALYLERS